MIVFFHGGGWQVEDCSSNGTYLNREDAPIGPAAPRPLRDGDRLRFGAYEIEVSVAADRPTRTAPDPFDGGTSGGGPPGHSSAPIPSPNAKCSRFKPI